MRIKSSIIPDKSYESDRCVYLTCIPQVQLYLQNDCELLDILFSGTRTNQLVFVFGKNEQTRKIYKIWNENRPKKD